MYRNLNLYLWKCIKTVSTRAAPFGSDMHLIICQLGLRPRPHWGSLQCSPDPLAGLGGGPPGKWKEGGQRKRREGREGGKGVQECPNPELASLYVIVKVLLLVISYFLPVSKVLWLKSKKSFNVFCIWKFGNPILHVISFYNTSCTLLCLPTINLWQPVRCRICCLSPTVLVKEVLKMYSVKLYLNTN